MSDDTPEVLITMRVSFTPDEVAVLRTLQYLRGATVDELAAEAFTDLFAWAREQGDVDTLLGFHESWVAPDGHVLALVDPPQ